MNAPNAIDAASAPASQEAVRPRRREWAIAMAAYVAMTIVTTWPMALTPATRTIEFGGDVLLNAYILEWAQYALTHCPARLFDANFMHPFPHAICLSENMIVPAILALPLAPLGNPVLLFNAMLGAALAGSAWIWNRVLRRWGVGPVAAWLGGLFFGFSPWRMGQMAHLQLLLGWWMPLTLWGLDGWLRGGSWRWAALAGASLAAQFYSCVYLFYFTALFAGPFVVVGLFLTRKTPRRWLFIELRAIGAGALLVALLAPSYRPYRRTSDLLGHPNSLESVSLVGAVPGDYLRAAPSSLIYGSLWMKKPLASRPWANEFHLWLGWAPMLMAASLPVLAWSAKRRRVWPGADGSDASGPMLSRCWMLAAGGAFLVLLSLGPELHWRVTMTLPWYRWIFLWAPGFDAVRVPSRAGGAMGGLALSGMAAVAIDGWTRLARRRGARWGGVLVTLFVAAGVADMLNRPLPVVDNLDYLRLCQARKIAGSLAPGRAELVLPFVEYSYMAPCASGPDFPLLVNGVSGYIPAMNWENQMSIVERSWGQSQWDMLRRLNVGRILLDRRMAAKQSSEGVVGQGLREGLAKADLLEKEREVPGADFVIYDLKASSAALAPVTSSARPVTAP